MELTQDLIIYLLGLAVVWGSVLQRLKALEKKQDVHNGIIERTFKLEERAKSNTHRLDSLEERIEKK